MTRSSKRVYIHALGIMFLILNLVDSSIGQSKVEPLPDDTHATENEKRFILRAYEIARSAVAHGNHPFGALLVHEGKIVAEFENDVITSKDLTKHAETGLVGYASTILTPQILSESTLYTSTEPCLMCCGAIYWADIKAIVYGTSAHQLDNLIVLENQNLNMQSKELFQRLRPSESQNHIIPSRELFQRIRPEVVIIGPVLEKEGLSIHAAFWPEFIKQAKDH